MPKLYLRLPQPPVTFTPISPHISAKVVRELFPDDDVSDLELTFQLELIASSLTPPATMSLPQCLHDDVSDVESSLIITLCNCIAYVLCVSFIMRMY